MENPDVEKIKSVVTTKVGSVAVVVVITDAEAVVKTTGVVTAPLNTSFKGSADLFLSDPLFKKSCKSNLQWYPINMIIYS